MPRPGWRKPEAASRLSDAVSVGLLTRVFDGETVDAVLDETGRREQRVRQLPAQVMVYFAIGMALHNEGSYDDVLALICDGLSWAEREDVPARLANKAAISHARTRLGSVPVKELFRRTSLPLAHVDAPGCFLAGRRLVAIDGTCLDVPDTPANDEHFSRPGTARGERAAFPQARVVGLAECGTHAVIDAETGPYSVSETGMALGLLDRLEPGMLCLADRGFYSHAAWTRAAATGADLCWRVKSSLKLPIEQELADGSYLSNVYDSRTDRTRARPTRVRVIEYTLDDGSTDTDTDTDTGTDTGTAAHHGHEGAQSYRLLTTLLNPEQAPAVELAAAYTQRWEIETTFDELKTHQRGPRQVLRSAKPDLVYQEIYGHLCCHYAIRTLMYDAATTAGHDPDQTSFVAALRISRRSIAQQSGFPPRHP